MRDRRPVDELSIEELERILAIRKREERQKRVNQLRSRGRVLEVPAAQPAANPPAPPATIEEPAAPVVARPGKRQPEAVSAPGDTPEEPALFPAPALESVLMGAMGQAAAPSPAQPPVRVALAASPPPAAVIDDYDPSFEDEPAPARTRADDASAPPAKRKGGIVNRLLLLVEIAAVAGLVFIGVNLLLTMSKLETESAEAQRLANEQRLAGIPTLEPTAILRVSIDDYVLPGGHTIDANGAAQFNLDEFIAEVPSHLQSQVISQVFPVDFRPPPPTSETALYVNIPQLGIDQSIFQGTDWETLKKGVGQVLNGANPGDTTGNVVLAAHNDIYGELFRYLDKLQPGDEFYIQTATRTYTYRVTGYKIVNPTDVYVMEDQGRPTVTLISCYPYQVNTQRYVVFAERVEGAGA
jgi:sortase A